MFVINDDVSGTSSFANMGLKIDVILPAYIRISWLGFGVKTFVHNC